MNYVINENNSLVNIDIQELAFNAAHPIGEIYIQYPGKKDPQTLYGRGTWTNKSSEFAGLFFRAEGGNANAFNGGNQEDKIRNIWGGVVFHGGEADGSGASAVMDSYGVFKYGAAQSNYSNLTANTGTGTPSYSVFEFDANRNNEGVGGNTMAGHADGPEIRPVNTTIRIWERTA